ncbi:DNA primase small subunit PriS [Candidatus Norongarragalina meridionalis]|nr:DNA primase small subunit PriS [Candidatus Norongarragalina meridionalis]
MNGDYVRERLSWFYSRFDTPPHEVAKREFGFGWNSKIDQRHKSFPSPKELREFLRRESPLYASYSVAYYQIPDGRPMQRKGFLGAEIAFDIDKPRIGEHGHNGIICPACLDAARTDALQLLEEYLLGDFGFSSHEVTANFSGSKGYHLHVDSEAVRQLGSDARREIVEYASEPRGELLVEEEILGDAREFYEEKKRGASKLLRGPDEKARGWGKKFHDEAVAGLKASPLDDEKKKLALENLRRGNYGAVKGTEKIWEAALAAAKAKHALVLDKQVTLDTARLIRMPETIHGGTGFVAKKCDLKKFDPLRDALAFPEKNMVRVKPAKNAAFELMGKTFEVKEGVPVDMPEPAAMLLLLKGYATLA